MDDVKRKGSLRIINSDQCRPIEEWERFYPDLWLFIEVTREDEWEVYEGKLVATAEEPMEFVELGKSYRDRGIVNLTTRGVYTEPQPAFVG
ncbi:MAG: hypothetical protein AABN34_19500 [Acidobacteriota bacterium]